MKKYVFLTNSIRNMGGAQMYLRNKLVFLKKQGWSVSVYFFNEGEILIPELQEYRGNRIPEMLYPISAIRRNKVSSIIEKIVGDTANFEHFIVEPLAYHLSYWGEAVAEKASGKNLLFLLQESFPEFTKEENAYLQFKAYRKELMNGSRFKHLKFESENNLWRLPSYSNVTAPIDYTLNHDTLHRTILSLGRLDKPYVMPMLEEIVAFTKKTKMKVNLFLVGGSADNTYMTTVRSYLEDKELITPYYFGYMFPVPEIIIKAADVAIASSGSVLVPTELGIPTIAIDAHDYMAMGIYGETTQNTFVRKTEPQLHISDILNEVLVEGRYINVDSKPSQTISDSEKILWDQLRMIESLDAPKEYYDVFSVYNRKEIMKQKTMMVLYELLGESGVEKVAKMKHKIFGR